MKRLLEPFVVIVTAMLAVGYAYTAWRLTATAGQKLALVVPFAFVWIVPVVYWGGARDEETVLDDLVHRLSYLCMAWVSFVIVLTLARDLLLVLTFAPETARLHADIAAVGVPVVYAGSIAALVIGMAAAVRGPRVKRVDVAIANLNPALEGFTIAQVSDLHVGRSIRRRYVERVVRLAQDLRADLIALTGDIVDGSVADLASEVEPLRALTTSGCAFFVLGNHDCYSGARAWTAHFRELGFRVLLNSHEVIDYRGVRIVVGGVLDPALARFDRNSGPRPDVAMANAPDAAFRLLLAHNPKIAPAASRAGFDLQLSGHTHAGQFFPWTLAVKLVHAPHASGLSREGAMVVYVSAGTGTWGPPVRLGTSPELTLLRLVRA